MRCSRPSLALVRAARAELAAPTACVVRGPSFFSVRARLAAAGDARVSTHARAAFLSTRDRFYVECALREVSCCLLTKNTVGAAGAATPLYHRWTMPPPASSKASSGGVHSTGTPSSAYFDIRQPRRYVTARDARCAQISTQALICKLVVVQEGVVYAVKIGNGDVRNAFPGFISAYRLRRVGAVAPRALRLQLGRVWAARVPTRPRAMVSRPHRQTADRQRCRAE